MHILNPSLRYAGFFNEMISSTHQIDEVGVMDTKDQDGSKSRFFEEKTLMGDVIVLKAFIKRIPLAQNSSTVTLIMEGESFKSHTLYDEQTVLESPYHAKDCRHESLQIIYKGHGYLLKEGEKIPFANNKLPNSKLGVSEGDVLLSHHFDYVTTSVEQRISTFAPGLKLTSPPGCVNATVLMPYGGYAPDVTNLEEIKQIYFTLTATQDETRIILENVLAEEAPHARKKVVHHPPKKHSKSFVRRMIEGDIKLTVETNEIQQFFRSFSYHTLPSEKEVEIYFHPINIEETQK